MVPDTETDRAIRGPVNLKPVAPQPIRRDDLSTDLRPLFTLCCTVTHELNLGGLSRVGADSLPRALDHVTDSDHVRCGSGT